MKRFMRFIFIEFGLFLIMGLITLLEVDKPRLFVSLFTFIKSPSSWFVGLSLAYAFSNTVQTGFFSLFSKRIRREGKEKGDFFIGFIITLVITALTTPYVYQWAGYLFSNFFIYFHVILLQSVILVYLLFKLKGNYPISMKYFLTTQAIVLVYTLIILSYVAA
jgi:hypothetical protein